MDLRRFINERVKEREWYRPLAPSVLDEFVGDWFEGLQSHQNESPFMSLTATVKEGQQGLVPAICHVDGTARLQTVSEVDNALYHRLIKAFFKLAGVPMVLNTSFNRKSQPIVESPSEAIQTFLSCQGDIDHLYLGSLKISVKPFPWEQTDGDSKAENVLVFGETVYLSEVTSSSGAAGAGKSTEGGVDRPVRVRIQDGGWSSDQPSSQQWRDLPSLLHLEILQLLQQSSDSGDDDSSKYVPQTEDSSTLQSTITVSELFAAIQEIQSDSELAGDVDAADAWTDFDVALRWLYNHGLVYFENLDDDERVLQNLLEGSEVLDLRSIS